MTVTALIKLYVSATNTKMFSKKVNLTVISVEQQHDLPGLPLHIFVLIIPH